MNEGKYADSRKASVIFWTIAVVVLVLLWLAMYTASQFALNPIVGIVVRMVFGTYVYYHYGTLVAVAWWHLFRGVG